MGIKSFFLSLNKITLCRLLDNLYTGREKKEILRKKGRKALPHLGATLQTEPWAPMECFRAGFWSWALPEALL